MPHSKGPFEVVDYGQGKLRIEANGNALALVWPTDPKTRKRSPEFIGNAHLFAASPDMLAVLKQIAEWSWPDCGKGSRIYNAAHAAIAKAEGRAS